MMRNLKILIIFSAIAMICSQCPPTDADNIAMMEWAKTTVTNQLSSTVNCPGIGQCVLTVRYPTPAASIFNKVKEFVNFIGSAGQQVTQTFTSVDANGYRTLTINFSISVAQTLGPVVNQSTDLITYTFPVNVLLQNSCLSMGLALLTGNISISINRNTNVTVQTRSSMLQSNLPSCSPACTVSTVFLLNAAFCSDATCNSIVPAASYKLGDRIYIKAILPDALKTQRFALYQATYALLNNDGTNVYQSADVSSTITTTQGSGFNVISWVVPISTEILGSDGRYTGNLRTISLNMFFRLTTSRQLLEVRFLQTPTEVSQPLKTAITLEPMVQLNSGVNATGLPGASNSTAPINGSGSAFISGIGMLVAFIFALLL